MSNKLTVRKLSQAGGILERYEGKGVEWRTSSEVDKAISLEVGRVVGSHLDYLLSDTKARSSTRGNSNSNNAFNNDSESEKNVDLEQIEDGHDVDVGNSGNDEDNPDNNEENAAGPADSDHNQESLEPTGQTPPVAGPHNVNVNRENDNTVRQYNGRGRGRASSRTGQPNRPAVVDYGLPDDVGDLVDEDEFEFVFDLEPSSDVDPAVIPNTLAGPVPTMLQVREAAVAGGSVLAVAPEVQPLVIPPTPTFDILLDVPAAPVTNAIRNPMNPARQTLMTGARPELLADLLTDSGESVHDIPQQQSCLKISDIIYSDYACSAGSSDEAELPNSQNDDTTAESMATASSSLRQEVKLSLNLKNIDGTSIGLVGDGINTTHLNQGVPTDKNQDDLLNENDDGNTPSDSPFSSDGANQDDQDIASAEYDFRSLDFVLDREPLNVLGERTEQDADALLELVINGVRDKGMGPNSLDELEVASPECVYYYYDRELSRSTEKSSHDTNSASCNNTSISDNLHEKNEGEACLSSPQSSSIQSDDHLMECDTQANASVQAKDDELLGQLESVTGVFNTTSSFHDDVGEPFVRQASNIVDGLDDKSGMMCSGLKELSEKPVGDLEYDWPMSMVNVTYEGAKNNMTQRGRDQSEDEPSPVKTLPINVSDDENKFVFGQHEKTDKFELEFNDPNEYNQDQIKTGYDICQKGVDENSEMLDSNLKNRLSHEEVEPCPYENNLQPSDLSLGANSVEEEYNNISIDPLKDTTTLSHPHDFPLPDSKVESWPEDLLDNNPVTANTNTCVVSQSKHNAFGVEGSPPVTDMGPEVWENRYQGYENSKVRVEANNVVSIATSESELILGSLPVDHSGVQDLKEVCSRTGELNLSDLTFPEFKSMDIEVCDQSCSNTSTHLNGTYLSETSYRENLPEDALIPEITPNQNELIDTTHQINEHETFGITQNEETSESKVVVGNTGERNTRTDDTPLNDFNRDSRSNDQHEINVNNLDNHKELNDDSALGDLHVCYENCAHSELTNLHKYKKDFSEENIISNREKKDSETNLTDDVTRGQSHAGVDVCRATSGTHITEEQIHGDDSDMCEIVSVKRSPREPPDVLTETQSKTRLPDGKRLTSDMPGCKDSHELIVDDNHSELTEQNHLDIGAEIEQKHNEIVKDLEANKADNALYVLQEKDEPVNDVQGDLELEVAETALENEDHVNNEEDALEHGDTVISKVQSAQLNYGIIAEENKEPNSELDVPKEQDNINFTDISTEHDVTVNDRGENAFQRDSEGHTTHPLDRSTFEDQEQDEICTMAEKQTKKVSSPALDHHVVLDGAVQNLKSSMSNLDNLAVKPSHGTSEEYDLTCRPGGDVRMDDEGAHHKTCPLVELSRAGLELDDVTRRHGTSLEDQGDCKECPGNDDTKPLSDQPVDLDDELSQSKTVNESDVNESISIDRQERFLYQHNKQEHFGNQMEQEIPSAGVVSFDLEVSEKLIGKQKDTSSAHEEMNLDENEVVLKGKKVRFGHLGEGSHAKVREDNYEDCENQHETSELGTLVPKNVHTVIDNSQNIPAEINDELLEVNFKLLEQRPTDSSFGAAIENSSYDNVTDTNDDIDKEAKVPTEFEGPTRRLSNSSLELEPSCRATTPEKQRELEDFDAMISNIRMSCVESLQGERGETQDKEKQIEDINEVKEPGFRLIGQTVDHVEHDGVIYVNKNLIVHKPMDEESDKCGLDTENVDCVTQERLITDDVLGKEGEQWHSEEDFFDGEDILKVVERRDESSLTKTENADEPCQAEILLNTGMDVINEEKQTELHEQRTSAGEGDQCEFIQNTGNSDNPRGAEPENTISPGSTEPEHIDTFSPGCTDPENIDTISLGGTDPENIDTISLGGAEPENMGTILPGGAEPENIDIVLPGGTAGGSEPENIHSISQGCAESEHIDTNSPGGAEPANIHIQTAHGAENYKIDTDSTREDFFDNIDTKTHLKPEGVNIHTITPCGYWFDSIDTDTPREAEHDSVIDTAVSFYAGVDTNILEDTQETALGQSSLDCHLSLASTTQVNLPKVFLLTDGTDSHLDTSGMSSGNDEDFRHAEKAGQEENCDMKPNMPLLVDVTQSPHSNIIAAPVHAQRSPRQSRTAVNEWELTNSMTAVDNSLINLTVVENRYQLDPAAKVILDATDLWLNKISDICQTPTIEMEGDQLHEIADKCTSELLSLVKSRSEENGQEASASSKSTSRDAINNDLSSTGKSVAPLNRSHANSSPKPPSVSISRRSGSMSRSTDGVPKSSSGTSSPGLVGSRHGLSMGGHQSASTTSSTDIDITMSRSGTRPNSCTDGLLTRDGSRYIISSASPSGDGNSGTISESEASLAGKNRQIKNGDSAVNGDLHSISINQSKENCNGSLGNLSPRLCLPESLQNVKNTILTGLRPHSSGTMYDLQVTRPLVARPLSSRSSDAKTRDTEPDQEDREAIKTPQKVAGVLDLTHKTSRQTEATVNSRGRSSTVVLPSKNPLTDQCHEPRPPPVSKEDSLGFRFKREIKIENGIKRIALRANSGTRMQINPKTDEQAAKSEAVRDGPSPRRAGNLTPRKILKSQGTICDADLKERVIGGRQLFTYLQSSPRTSTFTQTDRLTQRVGQPCGVTRNKANTSPRGTGDGEEKVRVDRVFSVGIGDGTSIEKKERTKMSPGGSFSDMPSNGEVKSTSEMEAITQLNRQRMEPLKLRGETKKRSKAVKMMTMQEFEKIQAERHLTQAFARIQSSKPCVDCHMDAKVMDKTGMSTKRRRERINYDSLIALENLKFLEMLRFKKSAYDRDEQLRNFKKSYKQMVMMGRHPSSWKETGVDKLLTKRKHEEGSCQKRDIMGI